ncbi:MAG: ATP-binding protein [Spirochaetales bacterium]|nr:ATP-binding protein [Spirochaetales bacterium]
MDSLKKRRDFFASSLLALQQGVNRYPKDEPRLIEQLTDEVFRLSGAECLIVRSKGEGEWEILSSRCYDESDCNPEMVLQGLASLSEEYQKELTDGEGDSWAMTLNPPIPCNATGRSLGRVLTVLSSPFIKLPLELTLLNPVPLEDARELTQLLKGLINLTGDALEKSRQEEKDRSDKKPMADSMDAKTQFLGSLSHEIRSPLNGIICMGSLLRETELNEEQLELLDIIQFSADNITRIIQDLVDLTLLTSGQVILKNETFSLQTVCRNLIKNMKEEAESKGLSLGFRLEEGVDSFHGDSVRIGQILSNLLQNAVKYTREGEIFLSISLRSGGIEFVVSDTGVGIPRDKQDIIFDEFTQLGNPVQKDKARGVGLGLAIVKDLVEMMGGRVSVKSREGKGSSFTVLLPFHDDVEEFKEEKRGGETLFLPSEDTSFLIVDDDEINRLYLKMVLEGIGARTDEAENGRIAVEKVAGNKYDMILMDISMPVMNGLDATREIRKIKGNLPVLAVTANAFDEDFKRILDAGLDDIVLKPVDEVQLMKKISNWLERSRVDE